MFNEWYRDPERIKEKFEGDCNGLVTSQLIEHGKTALEELFIFEDIIFSDEKDNARNYLGYTDSHLGWNYFLYDTGQLDLKQAYRKAEIQFKDYLE